MGAENIVSGFRTCGIYPLNPAALPVDAFLPNSVYTVTQLMADRALFQLVADNEIPVGDNAEVIAEVMQDENAEGITQGAINVVDDIPIISQLNLLSEFETTLNNEQLKGYKFCYEQNIALPDKIFEHYKTQHDASQMHMPEADGVMSDQDLLNITCDDNGDCYLTASELEGLLSEDFSAVKSPVSSDGVQLVIQQSKSAATHAPNSDFPVYQPPTAAPGPSTSKAGCHFPIKQVCYFYIIKNNCRSLSVLNHFSC